MANSLNQLKQILAQRLQKGCENGSLAIRENTPIDTQRLHETVQATDATIEGSVIQCKITIGGQELFGIRRETDIKKPVNYAKVIEMRTGFVRQSLTAVTGSIADALED